MKRFLQSLCLLSLLAFGPFHSARAEDTIVQVAASNGQFKTLVNLLVVTGLDKALQSHEEFTVFAPTDEAFAKLPPETLAALLKPSGRETLANILKVHVVAGERSLGDIQRPAEGKPLKTLEGTTIRLTGNGLKPKIGNAQVVLANVQASNGIVHVIDDVLMPGAKQDNIVETAKSAGMFNTLLAALTAADLAGVFTGDKPFTVLAPTDEAFAKVPQETLASLLMPENKETLVRILKYHVIAGSVSAKDAIGVAKANTLEGSPVNFQLKDGKLTVENSIVLKNDIIASNGVIHVIDTVLMPPSKDVSAKSMPVAAPVKHTTTVAPAKKCPNQ
jgi:transforming growth factor-beta-induced protein